MSALIAAWYAYLAGEKAAIRKPEAETQTQAEAEAEQAEGIVGAQVKESSHGWGSHVIEYFAVGTAITAIREDHTIPAPTLTLPLTG